MTEMEEPTYTAANIRILSPLEAAERFGFARAAELAKLYPTVPTVFIQRLCQACQLSGWPVELAEQRYLAGDRSIQPPPEFMDCHNELLQEVRRR
jgi:hypothetical protein